MNHSTPYTYLIRNQRTHKVYYGVRYAKGCHPDDLFQTYFTSSSKVREDLDNGDKFDIEIRRTFKTKEVAIDWEWKVLRRMKVNINGRFLNMTAAPCRPALYGDDNPAKRPEVRRKLSEAAKKRIYTPEYALRMSKVQLARYAKIFKAQSVNIFEKLVNRDSTYITKKEYGQICTLLARDDIIDLTTRKKFQSAVEAYKKVRSQQAANNQRLRHQNMTTENKKIHGRKISAGKLSQGKKFWIQKEKKNKLILVGEDVPEGWTKGLYKSGSAWKKGRKHTDATKKQISEKHTGKKLTNQHKQALSESHKGLRWYTNTEGIRTFYRGGNSNENN